MAKPTDIRLDPWECRAWRPPPLETPDAWAERVIRLPGGVSSTPGEFSFALTPYLREVMRAAVDPETEALALCFSAQYGKTTALILIALHAMATDPWNQIFVMDSEERALELKRERFEPIIRESPELLALVDNESSFSGNTIAINGRTITFRGAHSPGAIASKPAKYGIGDEVDKWPPHAGKEADPVDLLEERLKTFDDSKLIISSTPTNELGRIGRQLEASTNERCWVPCPHCGTYQILVFGDGSAGQPGIKWPKDARFSEIIEQSLAWYECEHCHERIPETAKRAMVEAHVWCPKVCRVNRLGEIEGERPSKRRRGFHGWAGYSLWPKTSWSRIAVKWLLSAKVPEKRMNFVNSWLAETYKVTAGELKSEALRACEAEYYIGATLPESADVVTFGIDVQSRAQITYHYWVARAWAPGGRSWLIGYGQTTGWPQLYSILFESEYRTASGGHATKIMPVIDSGYRTGEVYQFCHENGALPYKGDTRGRKHLDISEVPLAPESPEKIRLVVVNADFFKTDLHRLIRSGDKWQIPAHGVDDEYHAHMVAEQPYRDVDRKTGRPKIVWRVKTPDLPNHYFDCEVMNLVGAGLAELGTRGVAAPASAPKEQPRVESSRPRPRVAHDPSGGYDVLFSG